MEVKITSPFQAIEPAYVYKPADINDRSWIIVMNDIDGQPRRYTAEIGTFVCTFINRENHLNRILKLNDRTFQVVAQGSPWEYNYNIINTYLEGAFLMTLYDIIFNQNNAKVRACDEKFVEYVRNNIGNLDADKLHTDLENVEIYQDNSEYTAREQMYQACTAKSIDFPMLLRYYNSHYDCIEGLPDLIEYYKQLDGRFFIFDQFTHDLCRANRLNSKKREKIYHDYKYLGWYLSDEFALNEFIRDWQNNQQKSNSRVSKPPQFDLDGKIHHLGEINYHGQAYTKYLVDDISLLFTLDLEAVLLSDNDFTPVFKKCKLCGDLFLQPATRIQKCQCCTILTRKYHNTKRDSDLCRYIFRKSLSLLGGSSPKRFEVKKKGGVYECFYDYILRNPRCTYFQESLHCGRHYNNK